jgi:hypothetical protein
MDEERMSNWRWGLYFGSLVFGVLIPVVGGLVEKIGGGWAILLTM